MKNYNGNTKHESLEHITTKYPHVRSGKLNDFIGSGAGTVLKKKKIQNRFRFQLRFFKL